ncbi:MAG: class I SAM-dependent methyltransferase [Candidatus Acidiferrales bacterium]
MRAVNLGCGQRFHPDWENLDFAPVSAAVRACDLQKGIPFPDGTFDVVYHSHVLEHFPKQFAPSFLRECHRVLKSGGVIRVAIPDLETIARIYLEALHKASSNQPGWAENYDWIVLEMYDQAVRERTCGSATEFFRREVIPNWDFVYARWGSQAKTTRDFVRAQNGSSRFSSKIGYALRHPVHVTRNQIVKTMLGKKDYQALQVGRFRRQGEIHQWMYDRYSLARLLRDSGFRDPLRREANESLIPDWTKFNLDTESDGTVYKPDSMYMEATKP